MDYSTKNNFNWSEGKILFYFMFYLKYSNLFVILPVFTYKLNKIYNQNT